MLMIAPSDTRVRSDQPASKPLQRWQLMVHWRGQREHWFGVTWEPVLEIQDIQGNILAGFNKDFQTFCS